MSRPLQTQPIPNKKAAGNCGGGEGWIGRRLDPNN